MENYNNKIRDIVFDKKSITDGLPPFLDDVGKKLYDKVKNSDNEVIKKMFVSVLYLDSYKYLNLFSEGGLSFEPTHRKMFEQLDSYKSYDEIEEFVLGSENFFDLAVEQVYQLKKSSALYKIMTYENLTDEQNKKLISLFPSHEEDLKKYNISVDMNYIIDKINQSFKSHNDIYNISKDLTCYLFHAVNHNKTFFDDFVKEVINILNNNTEIYEPPTSDYEARVFEKVIEMKNMDEEKLKNVLSNDFYRLSMTAGLFIAYKTEYGKIISEFNKEK